jgi:hypothetical protein
MDSAGWNMMFGYFGEQQEVASAVRSAVGAVASACRSGSAKDCN